MQQSQYMVIMMNITNQPQYQLHLLTLHFLGIHDILIPKNCDERCVDATIINRAYYSSYLYCELWLEKIHNFKVKHPWEFKKGEKRAGEHKQVRDALLEFGEGKTETHLQLLAKLRKKADYYPNKKITPNDVNNAIRHMKKIFSHLKIE